MIAYICAALAGLIIVLSKFINHAAASKLGLLPGTLINYIVGTMVALLLAIFMGGATFSSALLFDVPWYYYLSGICGLIAMIISNKTLHRLPVLHSTSLIIVAQMSTALLIDAAFFGQYSLLKVCGACLVVVALIWDQKIIKASS